MVPPRFRPVGRHSAALYRAHPDGLTAGAFGPSTPRRPSAASAVEGLHPLALLLYQPRAHLLLLFGVVLCTCCYYSMFEQASQPRASAISGLLFSWHTPCLPMSADSSRARPDRAGVLRTVMASMRAICRCVPPPGSRFGAGLPLWSLCPPASEWPPETSAPVPHAWAGPRRASERRRWPLLALGPGRAFRPKAVS